MKLQLMQVHIDPVMIQSPDPKNPNAIKHQGIAKYSTDSAVGIVIELTPEVIHAIEDVLDVYAKSELTKATRPQLASV
jgi:hypothetical protein